MTTSVRRGVGQRLRAATTGLLFALALAARGLCPMAATEVVGEHACCQTGLQATAPTCCLDAPAANATARVAPVPAVLAPMPASFVLLGIPATRTPAPAPLDPSLPGASPPPVLRI